MSEELALIEGMDERQRRFFDLLGDSTSPAWLDVEKAGSMVFGTPQAGQMLMSTPAGRAWRELYLRRNRDGVAEMLERIAMGDLPRTQTRTVYRYDDEGRMVAKSAIVTTRQPTPAESMKAMYLLEQFGKATDNIVQRVQPRRSREQLLA